MKWIVLAAGLGKRLGELTRDCPKPLIVIYDRPMICLPLERMVRAGITDIGIVIPPRFRGQFEDFFWNQNNTLWAHITLIEQTEALGMAHAVNMAREFVWNESCIVLAGDSVNSFDFTDAIRNFQKGANIFARREPNPTIQKASGVVEIDHMGKVIRITEKPEIPASDLLQIGGGIYDTTLFDRIEVLQPSARGEYEITGVHTSYIETENIVCTDMGDTYYNNVTYPADVENASEWLRENASIFMS